MKKLDPEVYRLAANLLEDGYCRNGCCSAISDALFQMGLPVNGYETAYHKRFDRWFQPRTVLFDAHYFGDTGHDWTTQETRNAALAHRVIALLFLAAMVENP